MTEMAGKDFIQVAEELSDGASEAHWRSATSRAYYAAFHVAREALVQGGISVPRSASGHERVIRCLGNAQDRALAKAATVLGTLRTSRNKADYQFTSRPFSKGQAGFNLENAKTVITRVEESLLGTSDSEGIVAVIKQYLQDSNQLHG